jgi:branched-chain amino acid transport system substrate-binding protein
MVPGGVASASPATPPAGAVMVPMQPPPPGQLVGPIKIVSSLPRSGANKQQTDSMVTAIKMALDEVGHRIDGAQVVYEDLDDASSTRGAWDADREAENAQKAVADPDVMVYIGPYNSGAARVAIPILNQAGLVAISPTASYAGLTKPGKGLPNEPEVYYPSGARTFARVIPADDVQGAVAASWAQQLGATRVFVLHDKEVYGTAIAAAFVEAAPRSGLEIISESEGVDRRARDLTGITAKVRDARPDLVYYAGLTDNNAGALFRELRAAVGPDVKLMGPDGLYQQGFIDEAAGGAAGTFVTFGALAPSRLTGKGAEWYRNYKVRFNAEPEVFAAYAYEATKVAIDAIKRAGRKDRGAIRDAVFATRDYEGVLGRWSFDANGDTTLTTISGREVKGGAFDDANAVTLQAPPP